MLSVMSAMSIWFITYMSYIISLISAISHLLISYNQYDMSIVSIYAIAQTNYIAPKRYPRSTSYNPYDIWWFYTFYIPLRFGMVGWLSHIF